MATYPISVSKSISYEDYLGMNEYTADSEKGITRVSSKQIRSEQALSDIIGKTLKSNSSFLANTIDSARKPVGDASADASTLGPERVRKGLASCHADFDIAMGKVIVPFDMKRPEIEAGVDRIIAILEERRKIEAQEHFRDALECYSDSCRFADRPQWVADSLGHFLDSVKGYERNPLAHLCIGHIYHYQKEQRNFEKALHHYELCYTYGEADEKERTIAALGYFYAGWLKAAVLHDFEVAIKLTARAIEIDRKLGEAHYHMAKFHALREEAVLSLAFLKKAIVSFDRYYCNKVAGDADFSTIQEALQGLSQQLREEAKASLIKELDGIDRNFDPKDHGLRAKKEEMLNLIDETVRTGNYFACRDARREVKALLHLLAEAGEARKKYYERAVKAVQEWDDFLGRHTATNRELESDMRARLEAARRLLASDDHTEHSEAIRITEEIRRRNAGIRQAVSLNDNTSGQTTWLTKEEHLRRKREGLCLACGQSIGFLLKMKGCLYCSQHRQ